MLTMSDFRAVLARALMRPLPGGFDWAAATAIFVAATVLRVWLGEPLGGYPFLSYVPAVVIATVFCGRWPAAALAAAAGITAALAFARHDADLSPVNTGIALLFFWGATALQIALIEALRSVLCRLQSERARGEELLAMQQAMFHELQHRVANNMQFISSVLTLQARRVHTAQDAGAALLDATRRLDVLARIHRRLYDPENVRGGLGMVIEAVCRDLLNATGASNIVCRVDIAPVAFPMERLTVLSLLITELLTNAIKHAFTGRDAGTIGISLQPLADGHYALEVRDDGVGLPENYGQKNDSLGMRVIQSLAQRLGATMAFRAEHGTVARVEFATRD